MRYYETLYLINPNLADEDYRGVISKFNDLVEKNNGVITSVDEWGKKALAYNVKKFHSGYYVLLQYCGEPDVTQQLQRNFRLDDRILKFQTVKLSDVADPDALKAKAEERRAKIMEKTETPDEVSSEGADESAEAPKDEYGVQQG
jgi:small subunit ribosomal protein S6